MDKGIDSRYIPKINCLYPPSYGCHVTVGIQRVFPDPPLLLLLAGVAL